MENAYAQTEMYVVSPLVRLMALFLRAQMGISVGVGSVYPPIVILRAGQTLQQGIV